MRRYIVSGTPGAGKTVLVEELRARGYAVVAEAATDVIAELQARGVDEPWRDPGFLDAIVAVQRERQCQAPAAGVQPVGVQIFDRSPICTLALAHYGGQSATDTLAAEVERILRERVYERQVFFVRPLGFITPTAARRITLAESVEFERIHEEVYRAHGFELVDVPPGEVAERAAMVERLVRSWSGKSGAARI
ncbi:AAA family ATPase [Streptosporangiaceae bacterium NEAU-GS5]|nr:AAA family ATPase [Streptosporangiaceae bacterium NEAU-GS5]